MQRVLVPAEITPLIPAKGSRVFDYQGQSMGTTWSVRLVDPHRDIIHAWQSGIQQQLDTVVAEMSHWAADSCLGRYNKAAAGSWHDLPAAFYEVLAYALHVAAQSQGAYDPTAGALVNVWGFGPSPRYDEAGFVPPDRASIEGARQQCGWQALQIDHIRQRIFQPGGLLLDLSAVAKGFAVDYVARYLEGRGVQHYLVEVGGELRGAGMKPDGQPWWVGLEEPPAVLSAGAASHASPAAAALPTLLALHGLSVATSGDYRRCFEWNGRVCAHTLDPRNGEPLSTDIASVTVLHRECMAADALSTALAVMGVEAGLRYANTHGIAVRFLLRSAQGFVEHGSPQFYAMVQ
jgi:thiamine biosynthesis lipoprotein